MYDPSAAILHGPGDGSGKQEGAGQVDVNAFAKGCRVGVQRRLDREKAGGVDRPVDSAEFLHALGGDSS